MPNQRFNLKDHLLELFDVYKHERKGVIFFSIVLAILIGLNFSFPYWVKPPKIDTSQLDSLIAIKSKPTGDFVVSPKTIMDVNSTDTADWLHLGFSKRQIQSIFKYRKIIGGAFKNIDQLQKVYVVDSAHFNQISKYLKADQNEFDYEDTAKIEIKSSYNETSEDKVKPLFNFDPNVISYDSLLLLGFFPKQASSLIKYREFIRQFEKPQDLLELYLYSAEDHNRYSTHIKIDEERLSKITSKKQDKSTFEFPIKQVELNSADTADLIKLYGIATYSASRIIKYREKLGGYYSPDQLYEIKGLNKETLDNLYEGFLINESAIKKININSCKFNELLAHPYFDYYETKLIINYRDEHGKFISLRDLKKVDPLPEAYIQKIGHYLSFE